MVELSKGGGLLKYRKLDINRDYTFGAGVGNFVTDLEAVSQAITTNLLLFMGEWWENKEKGLPLFQNILGQPGNPENSQAADLLIQSVIITTPGVKSIKEFNSIYDQRIYTLSCIVETIYGNVTVKEVFNGGLL